MRISIRAISNCHIRAYNFSGPARTQKVNSLTSLYHTTVGSRAISCTTARMDKVVFSEGSNEVELQGELEGLIGESGRWTLIESGKGLERSFRFKTFKKTWEFMNTVAAQCAVQKHHPEWSNLYNTTFIRWTTHSPPGLSKKDIIMAKFCDEAAAEHGVIVDDNAAKEKSSTGGIGKDLADRVAVEGGDCCVPKKKS